MSNSRALIILVSVFIASLVTANLIGSKLVIVGGITVSAGLFVFPFTFLVCDLISEMFGEKVARQVVYVGLAVQVYVLFFIYLGGALPPSPRRDVSEAYSQMFALAPRMVLASLVAYTVSQLLDVRIFHICKRITQGRHLWLRKNLSTFISQAIDTAIFLGIFLGGVLPFSELAWTFVPNYLVKITMAVADTPLVYLCVHLLRGENSESAAPSPQAEGQPA